MGLHTYTGKVGWSCLGTQLQIRTSSMSPCPRKVSSRNQAKAQKLLGAGWELSQQTSLQPGWVGQAASAVTLQSTHNKAWHAHLVGTHNCPESTLSGN